MKKYIADLSLLVLTMMGCNGPDKPSTDTNQGIITPTINYSVVNSVPHDTNSFTEGFLFHEGQLYESSGAPERMSTSKSAFGIVDFKTGSVTTKVELDKSKYFGEGIVFFGNKVYQLTYREKVGFIYDSKTFAKLGEFVIPSAEGWGMTTDSTNIIMSDGTSLLTWLDPATLQVQKKLAVSSNSGAVDNLNELEFINGYIYANVYGTAIIVKIDPASGKVLAQLDLSSIKNEVQNLKSSSLEMNGIAYDPATRKVYVTGKLWPKTYEINFSF